MTTRPSAVGGNDADAPRRERALLGRLGDTDLRLLRIWKSVVDCGGMAAAELELNIAGSTISRHVADLEQRLGLVLCRRGRAGFALTPEGERVHAETLRLLAAVEAFRASVDDIHRRMGGRLDVALFDKTATNPAARIGAAIARFAAEAPDVELQLHVGTTHAIERGVLDGRFQVGVIPAHRASRALAYADLFAETMLLFAGRDHPLFTGDDARLTWSALQAHDFAGLGFHSPNMELSHRHRLARRATAFDQEGIATLVLSGRYLGFLPDHYARGFEQAGRLRALAPKRFRYACTFVSLLRRSPAPSRAAALFGQCLAEAHRAG